MLTAEPAAPDPGSRRNVLLWVIGTGVSVSGDAALWLALSIWVKELTGSNAQAGLAFLAFIAPRLLTPFTAVLADRLPRRQLVVVLDLVLAAWVGLALLVRGPQDVALLYLVLVGVGLGSGLHHAAGGALLTRLVPRERLGQTNALLRTVQEVGLLVAPAVGTALYVTLGARSVAILDAATFLLCAGLVAAVRVREPKAEPRARSWGAELVAGVVHIARTPRIREVVLAMGGATLAFGFFESVIFAVADEGLHRPASFVGIATIAKGVGSVLGGLTAIRILRVLPAGREPRLEIVEIKSAEDTALPFSVEDQETQAGRAHRGHPIRRPSEPGAACFSAPRLAVRRFGTNRRTENRGSKRGNELSQDSLSYHRRP